MTKETCKGEVYLGFQLWRNESITIKAGKCDLTCRQSDQSWNLRPQSSHLEPQTKGRESELRITCGL